MFDTGNMDADNRQLADIANIAPVVLAKDLLVPVPEVFHEVLPRSGLQRGWATQVAGSPSGRVFAWALLSEVTRSGGWVAAVDVPGISLAAASEVGLSIERVLVISRVEAQNWADVMGALIGSVDVVMYASPQHRVQSSTYRKLLSRCRERGTILMQLASDSRPAVRPPVEVDVSFDVQSADWRGLGNGHGCLESRTVNVTVSGRRIPGQPRTGSFMVPDTDGSVRAVPDSTDPVLAIVN